MITAEQIPDEVVEVVAEDFFAADIFTNDLPDQRWQDVSELTRRIYRDFTRRAIAAALNAWPGWEGSWTGDGDTLRRTIILPLPQEKQND